MRPTVHKLRRPAPASWWARCVAAALLFITPCATDYVHTNAPQYRRRLDGSGSWGGEDERGSGSWMVELVDEGSGSGSWEVGLVDEEVDDCSSAPCKNGGRCTDGADSYSCTCVASATGANCEVVVTGLVIQSGNRVATLATTGDLVLLALNTSRAIDTPQCKFWSGGKAVANVPDCSTLDSSRTTWACTYEIHSNDSDGNVSFSVNFSSSNDERTGTVTNVSDKSRVTVDQTKPTLTSVTIGSSNAAQRRIAGLGVAVPEGWDNLTNVATTNDTVDSDCDGR